MIRTAFTVDVSLHFGAFTKSIRNIAQSVYVF